MHHRASNRLIVGILGGGQLGMLLARQARQWGLHVRVYLEREGTAPARSFAQEVVIGQGWSDREALARFAQGCQVVLLENEFVPAELLSELKVPTFPNLAAYGIFQDKLKEKELALACDVPVPPFLPVSTTAEVEVFLHEYKYGVLKLRQGGYDGFGNLSLTPATPAAEVERFLARGPCLVEAHIPFQMEVAVMVVRSQNQERIFPIAETIQQNHICRQVLAPARVSSETRLLINQYARAIVTKAEGLGLFGLEFFVLEDGSVLYNETAPRPHNSAHFTIEACAYSQFEALLRVALDLPFPSCELTTPCVGMLNLLGTRSGPPELEPLADFLDGKGQLWLYGKEESRPGRKMGHYTLTGDSPQEVLARLSELQLRYAL